MNVSDCMTTDPRVCAPDDTIQDAARTMKKIDAGFLPVGENDRLIGMITDRDLAVRAIADGMGPDTPVREVMTREVCYCYADEDLDEVAAQMSDLQVRRLPVLNRDKRLVGVISLGDISHADDDGGIRTAAALSQVTEPSSRHNQH
ncbi:CBS domain-containing protein [Brevundimonas sp.]|uniref:CBS domain-containing protein n=1 Tax=Brevundimonas sp. TaxID=1871086 RepID=UPI002D3EA6A1|nr:CBS domain-containing protein [Brevundimonas sp.]HYC97180.1 CBS domain-containing protein [Brevundimonas sp.]